MPGPSTPTTLNGIVLVAQKHAYNVFSSVNGSDSGGCDAIRDALLKAGWTWVSAVRAVGSITAPFGWGFVSFQRNVVTVAGTHFDYYDPRTEDPPTGINVQPVVATSDSSTSQTNLIEALMGTGLFYSAVATSPTVITLTALAPGTLGNNISIVGSGAISTGSSTTGGGWVMLSSCQNTLYSLGNNQQIQVTVATGAPSGTIQFNIVADGTTTVNYYLGQGTWSIFANDVSMYCRMTSAPSGVIDVHAGNRFIWICSPFFPDNFPIAATCSFIAQGDGFLRSLGVGNASNNVDTYINGFHSATALGNGGFSFVTYHDEGQTVLDPAGLLLLQYALISMPMSTEARITAIVADCFISSTYTPIPQQIIEGLQYFRAIVACNTPPSGTVFMITGDKATGSGEQTGEPVKPPTSPTGSTKQFAVGTGEVTQPGPDFTINYLARSSGDVFLPEMIGKTITLGTPFIGSPTAVIQTVTNTSNLTFKPAVGVGSGVKYTIQMF